MAAYLTGSIFVSVRGLLVQKFARQLLSNVTSADYLSPSEAHGWMRFVSPFSQPSIRRLGTLQSDDYDAQLARSVCIDILYGGGNRLRVANESLHGEYDRLKAEGEFRDSMAISGLILVATCLSNVRIPWEQKASVAVIVVVIVVALIIHARYIERQANSMFAHAVADGVVSTASLDQRSRRWDRDPRVKRPGILGGTHTDGGRATTIP
jgi:hypothetical protein